MSRNEILGKLIVGKLIASNVADALKNNLDFGDLLIYFSSKTKAHCLFGGFDYEMVFDEKAKVIERYKMSEELFLKHAKNYQADNFEPEQEVLLKIPKLLSEYRKPLEWLGSLESLSDMELGGLLVAIGEMLLEDMKQYHAQDGLSEAEELADGSPWLEVTERTLQTCRGFVQGTGIAIDELYPLLDSADGSDIVELTLEIKNSELLLFLGHIISIACYILTLAFYKEAGPGCSLPEFLDRFQGEDMSEMFILCMLNLAQDKLINKEKLDNCFSNKLL